MLSLKDFLVDLLEDLTTTEVAILEQDTSRPHDIRVRSYSRMEIGGDAIHLFSADSPPTDEELRELHETLLKTSTGARIVLREILNRALR